MDDHPQGATSLRRGPSPEVVLALACLPVFIGALDLTIVSAVLPTVIFDLKIPIQTELDDATWMVTGYLLSYAVSMTFMGRVSDILGRRRVFLICLAVFFFGSWWVAASDGLPAQIATGLARRMTGDRPDHSLMVLYTLISGRVVQAFGAGAMVPVSMALACDLFPPHRRVAALGLVGAVDTAGWVLGHLYGGIMVQYVPWQVLFWLNLPVTALVFVAIWWALRGARQTLATGGVDWLGTGLLSLGLIALNVGLAANQSTATAPLGLPTQSPPYVAPLLIAAGVAFVLFVWVEQRAEHPLLNLRLFADRIVATATFTNLLIGFCMMVGLVSVPLLVNAVGGRTNAEAALVSGYLLAAFTIPMALTALLGGLLAQRAGYRRTAVSGLALALCGFLAISRWQPEMARNAVEWLARSLAGGGSPAHLWWDLLRMVLGLALAGSGLGVTMAPIAAAVINAAHASERGGASALVIILRLIGMAVCLSTMTTYGLRRSAALTQRALTGVALPDGQALADLVQRVACQVTDEMALFAAAVCLLALAAALWLKPRASQALSAPDIKT